tara:strand:+ start:751 stop:1854 length:1104 start_codon:yes stop_codon:yes gene_type:complete
MIKKLMTMTLNFYLMRLYLMNFVALLFCLLGIVYLFDVVELLRRASKVEAFPLFSVLQMGMFKLPETGQQIFPFVVLFSAMFTFWQLSKRSELVVMRASGLSVWQFMAPLILSGFLIGLIQITMINPLSAHLIKRYEELEGQYLNKQTSLVTLSKQGLWLRQENENGMAVLHAGKIKMPEWQLQDVIVFFFDKNFNFLRRVDSKTAKLNKGEWQFKDAYTNKLDEVPERTDYISMATDLTVDEIEESFSDPVTISFWSLLSFSKTLEQAGFDSTPLKVHFQKLLSTPLLFLAMIFLAASVSLRPPRAQGTFLLIVFGIAMGFGVFFLSNFLQALGASGQIPVFISAWFPSIITFLLGLGVIMTLEDG